MKYVLDTNTLSFLMRGDGDVLAALAARARTDVVLPQPVMAEIEYGLARLPRSARQKSLRRTFDVLTGQIARQPWTDDVSRAFGDIKAALEHKGTPLEDFDIAVAAHAVATESVLVTDDVSHMSRIRGLRLENWRRRG